MERQTVQKAQKNPAQVNHALAQSARTSSSVANPLLELQRSIGNQALQRLIRSPYIQTKLQVSTPGDPYEQEADRVADTVMRMPEPKATAGGATQVQAKPLATRITRLVQREVEQPSEAEKEEIIATKPIIQRAVPLAVRDDDEEQEEKVAPKLATSTGPPEQEESVATKLAKDAPLQRQTREDEEKETLQTAPPIQRQRAEEEEEKIQTKSLTNQSSPSLHIHPAAGPIRAAIQRLCTECGEEKQQDQGKMVQRKSLPEELPDDDDVAEKAVQAKGGQTPSPKVTPSLAANIHAMNGGGSPLPNSTRAFFEPRFGADFSQVRVHTDSRASETAKTINARAFTVGQNIAFATGQYEPYSQGSQILLAHELTHVVQQNGERLQPARRHAEDGPATVETLLQPEKEPDNSQSNSLVLSHEVTQVAHVTRAPVPAVQRRIDPTAMTVTPELAVGLSDEDLAQAIADVRTYLDDSAAGDALYDAAFGNLQVLEAEQGGRGLSFAPVNVIDAAPPPTFEEEAAGMSLVGGMSSAPVCEGPAPAPVASVEGEVCHAPIAGPGLTRDQVVADYRTNARKLLTFFLDASRVWADTVVRKQLTTETGAVSEEAVVDLRAQGDRANELAKGAFDKQHILIATEYLIEHYVPREGTPVPSIAGASTVGAQNYIRGTFSRRSLDRMGYPQEIPDVVRVLETLGVPAAVTDADVEDHILSHATQHDFWTAGMDHLIDTGVVAWFPNADPEYDWRDRVYTDDEIIAVGVGYIVDDETLRFNARSLLELARAAEPIDPDIEAVLNRGSGAAAFNYVALRFVMARIRDAAASEYGIARQALEQHLSKYPILRMFVNNRAVLLNYLSTDTFMHGIPFRPIIDVSAISTTTVLPKLDTLLTEIWELQQKIASDDDFLFDTAIAQSVAPLIQLYREADPTYGDWIDAEFESNRKWEEGMSGLLTLAALLGFVVGSALTGGAAAPFLIAGVIASIGLAIRSQARADVTGSLAHTGLGSREMAAITHYQAWLDTAMAALGALQVLTRGVGAAARMLAATEEQAIMRITIARVYQAANLTTAEMAQIQAWQTELERILRQAVQIVDSGQGQTRWSQFMRSGHPRANLAVTRGNAIHSEAFELIDQGATSLPTTMARNQGVALPARGLPNRYPGRLPTSTVPMRPDVRIALPGGREAVFDFTTTGQLGHSAAYGNQSWVASVIELGY